jgi:hypothetical protein
MILSTIVDAIKQGMAMANQLERIDHIVMLLLENRSFDHMLGFLYADSGNRSPAGQEFDGLTGEEWNPDDVGRQIKVYKIQSTDAHPYLMPGADPGEGFLNTNFQLYSTDDPESGAAPDHGARLRPRRGGRLRNRGHGGWLARRRLGCTIRRLRPVAGLAE